MRRRVWCDVRQLSDIGERDPGCRVWILAVIDGFCQFPDLRFTVCMDVDDLSEHSIGCRLDALSEGSPICRIEFGPAIFEPFYFKTVCRDSEAHIVILTPVVPSVVLIVPSTVSLRVRESIAASNSVNSPSALFRISALMIAEITSMRGALTRMLS